MTLGNFIKNIFLAPVENPHSDKEQYPQIRFKVCVVDFFEGIESTSGKKIAEILALKDGLSVSLYDEPFNKEFLNLESRTLFDLIDKGQDILYKTGADILVWGYNEDGKLRLNFQTEKQYNEQDTSFLSILDCLYIPYECISSAETMPTALSNLVYGAVLSGITPADKEHEIRKKYLLKKVIDSLSVDNSAKSLSINFMPYLMNFLGIIYLSCFHNSDNEKDFKIAQDLFDTSLKHQDLISNHLHLGCIYYHLGQLYDSFSQNSEKKNFTYFKGAISNYRQAQKYLSKYVYPYDYGYISYKLSGLYFSYWKQKEDLQALRDSVFHLREAEKIFSYALFPEFWAGIEKNLGEKLSLLGKAGNNADIFDLAIEAFKNAQRVLTEKRDAFVWAKIQVDIGNIYYGMGRQKRDKEMLEESLEYFHDALYIFENLNQTEESRKLNISIAKASENLAKTAA